MKKHETASAKTMKQPEPFTPGITKGMVREHARILFRDKLTQHPLTLKDWVDAEKDLVEEMEEENVAKR